MAKGSCLCGEVKYTITGPPAVQALCHCLTCRKVSGSTYTTNVIVPATALNFTSGASKLKSFSTPQEIGITVRYFWCENCGVKIYKDSPDGEAFKGVVIVQAGTLDEGNGEGEFDIKGVKVDAELWIGHRVSWLPELEGVAQKEMF